MTNNVATWPEISLNNHSSLYFLYLFCPPQGEQYRALIYWIFAWYNLCKISDHVHMFLEITTRCSLVLESHLTLLFALQQALTKSTISLLLHFNWMPCYYTCINGKDFSMYWVTVVESVLSVEKCFRCHLFASLDFYPRFSNSLLDPLLEPC